MIQVNKYSTTLIFISFSYKIFFVSTEVFDWCSNELCGESNKHTMCEEFYERDGGPLCKNDKQGLSDAEKKIILDEHNKYRSMVARNQSSIPPASNMLEMQWLDELADSAQVWANQCKMTAEDRCRVLKTGESVGQAFEYQESSSFNREQELKRLMKLWFEEVDGLNEASIHNYQKRKMKEFYALMIWAKTYKLGCGMSIKFKEDGTKTLRLVCNYYPKGAIRGEQVYRVGSACSGCPRHSFCVSKESGLCRYNAEYNGQSSVYVTMFLVTMCPILQFLNLF